MRGTVFRGRGSGGQRDAGAGEEPGGQGGGVADGGGADAEQDADGLCGQVQVAAEAGGEDVVGDVEPAVAAGGAAVADGVDAAAAAAGVVLLLAAGGERDFQGCGQGFQVTGLHAGERGVVQDIARDAAGAFGGGLRFRGGPGAGRNA